jgi:hypothetical protein
MRLCCKRFHRLSVWTRYRVAFTTWQPVSRLLPLGRWQGRMAPSHQRGRDATEMDLDRITHPLRLAKGSHQPGSGEGCAMNAISCSARPLAILVQSCNDLLAGLHGYSLSPEDSLLALELGWHTVGTADVADTVIHAWVAELLTNPTWGVVRYASNRRYRAHSSSRTYATPSALGAIWPIWTTPATSTHLGQQRFCRR